LLSTCKNSLKVPFGWKVGLAKDKMQKILGLGLGLGDLDSLGDCVHVTSRLTTFQRIKGLKSASLE